MSTVRSRPKAAAAATAKKVARRVTTGASDIVRVERRTKESAISLELRLRGAGTHKIDTPVGFFSHMLETLATHARLDLTVTASGDTHVDYHHTVEDVGLALGEAIAAALGEGRGIVRFGTAYVPLDEAMARTVIDLSGRPYVVFEVPMERSMLLVKRDFPFVLIEEFLKSIAMRGKFNLHVDLLRGRNGHHAAEAMVKSFALALRQAVALTGATAVPSAKGTITA